MYKGPENLKVILIKISKTKAEAKNSPQFAVPPDYSALLDKRLVGFDTAYGRFLMLLMDLLDGFFAGIRLIREQHKQLSSPSIELFIRFDLFPSHRVPSSCPPTPIACIWLRFSFQIHAATSMGECLSARVRENTSSGLY